MHSMIQLAVKLEGNGSFGGAASFGFDVLAFKAHEAPQQVLQHCKTNSLGSWLTTQQLGICQQSNMAAACVH